MPAYPHYALGSVLAFATFAVACSNSDDLPPPAPTVADGTVAAESFPGKPLAVVATDDGGKEVSAPLDNRLHFAMDLPEPHRYRFSVDTDRGRVRVVFPRQNRTDIALSLTTSGALIHLGKIRHIENLSAPVLVDPAQCVDGTTGGAGVCTSSVSSIECADKSTSPARECSDLSLVLGYGPIDKVPGVDSAHDTFAVPSLSPPCEVYGCNLPPPPPDVQSPE